ncbi:MAG: GNAT family N-acetyltransferase [Euryarchaeota archaeon]|nr:GNAT family N-acetyltransferase [Euryarchaeota archaeon]
MMRGMMPDGVVIRPARRSDREAAAELWNEMMDYHQRISTIDFRRVGGARRIWMRFFDKHIGSRTKKAWVAERDGRLVGLVMGAVVRRPPVFRVKYRGHIEEMAVTAAERRKGIGSRLLKEYLAWVRKKGLSHVTLEAAPENRIGVPFWEKKGFRTILISMRRRL